MTPKQQREYDKKRKKEQMYAEKQREEKLKNWKLSDLDDDRKKQIITYARKMLFKYKMERGWKEMATGLKWILFFIGVAILINFGRILTIIEMLIKH
jgi:hypothetical protein